MILDRAASLAVPALRFTTRGVDYRDPAVGEREAPAASDLVEAVRLAISAEDLRQVGVESSADLALRLWLSASWMLEPIGRPQREIHQLERVPSSAATSPPCAEILGDELTGEVVRSIPSSRDLARSDIDVGPDEGRAHDYALEDQDEADGWYHQFLGYPRPLQGDVLDELSRMLDADPDPAVQRQLGALPHRLVLQVESPPFPRDTFGDMGRLFVFVPSADLADLVFDRSLVHVQCS